MKIALFSNSYLPYLSGITISVSTLKEELEQLGHTAFVVGPQYPGYQEADPKVLRLPSLPATYPGYRLVFPYSPTIFQYLKKEKIELIHVHQPFGVGMAARLLAKRMNIPFVYSFHTLFSRYVHNVPFVPEKPAQILIVNYLKFFCNQADTIIVPSEMVRRLLVARKVKKPIEVIPTGLRLNQIKNRNQAAEVRNKFKIPNGAKLLLYSGRISQEKNIPFLLQAFEKVRQAEPNTYLLMVGGGPKLSDYKKLAGQQVVFSGQLPRQEVLDCCFSADLFVYASITETQGLVLTEAKACGLAVAALFGGGISDVIKNGIDGYITSRNIDVFIEHILRLLRDDNLRKEMGAKAKEDAHNRFSSISVAKRIESVYNRLICK